MNKLKDRVNKLYKKMKLSQLTIEFIVLKDAKEKEYPSVKNDTLQVLLVL